MHTSPIVAAVVPSLSHAHPPVSHAHPPTGGAHVSQLQQMPSSSDCNSGDGMAPAEHPLHVQEGQDDAVWSHGPSSVLSQVWNSCSVNSCSRVTPEITPPLRKCTFIHTAHTLPSMLVTNVLGTGLCECTCTWHQCVANKDIRASIHTRYNWTPPLELVSSMYPNLTRPVLEQVYATSSPGDKIVVMDVSWLTGVV